MKTRQSSERLLVQGMRTGLYVLIVVLALFQHLSQEQFFNWELLKAFYVAALIGLSFHGLSLIWLDPIFSQERPQKGALSAHHLLRASFAVDLLLLSYLLFKTDLNQSIFLFMDLIVILLCGMVFGARGALLLACGFSGLTTLILSLGPDLKSLTFFFLLILNNVAFFSVAALSGLLADQLEEHGLSLSALRKVNESIVETIPSGLMSLDEAGVVMSANPGASNIFPELKNAELENSSARLSDLLPGFDWQSNLNQGRLHWVQERAGESISLSLQVLSQPVETAPFLLVVEDETQVKKLEFAVRQSEKLAAVGQLAAGIAHEIRNPLAGISGSVELLSQTAQNEDDRKLNRIILKEIDRLNHLISEFLDFAKPASIPVEIVDIAPLLNAVLDGILLHPKIRTDVVQERNIMSPMLLRAFPDQLRQVFLNIVLNAYQAMETSPEPVLKVMATTEEATLVIRFRDTGVGMKEETRKRMFEPFHTTKPKGTGLGLAITLKIIESHQGRIFVESALNQGTLIEIRFQGLAQSYLPT